MQIEVIESVTKTIGSLALAYPSLRRLGVADIIDALTTKGKERHVSTGQVIEILVLNRLSLRPTPISRIDAWAQSQAVEEVYSLAADALNDDRIGRSAGRGPSSPGRCLGGARAARGADVWRPIGAVAQRCHPPGLRGQL